MNINVIKTLLLNTSGTGTAILISALASTVLLGTIIVSQQSISDFMTQKSETLEHWQLERVFRHAMTLGGYLISHNLVLCKESGWEGKETNCIWNNRSGVTSEEFYLTRTSNSDTETPSKQLSYIGQLSFNTGLSGYSGDEYPNDPEDHLSYQPEGSHNYQISFHLQRWADTDLEPFLGKIPPVLCRHTETLEIIIEGSCENIDFNEDGSPDKNHEIAQALIKGRQTDSRRSPPNIQCRNSVNKPIDKSSCEFISMVDQDHYIVVITVNTHPDHPLHPSKKIFRSGIRRPLVDLRMKVKEYPSCPLQCATSLTGNFFPGCRGDSIPTGSSQASTEITDAKLVMEVTNNGPGAIYALSFFKTYTKLDGHNNEDAQQAIEKTVKVTEDILALNGKEVLLPSDDPLVFEDRIPCLTEANVVTQTVLAGRQPQWTGTSAPPTPPTNIEPETDIHSQKFMSVEYDLAYLQSGESFSVCVNANNKYVDAACPEIIQNPTSEQQETSIMSYSNKIPCGKSLEGTCRYPHIEPRKLFQPTPSELAPGGIKQKTSIIVNYILPH